jgi:hypothetical protein
MPLAMCGTLSWLGKKHSSTYVPAFSSTVTRPLLVKGDAPAGQAKPVADGVVRFKDFAFELPTEIKVGTQTWQVFNDGPQTHEIALIKLAEGATLDDMLAFDETAHDAGVERANAADDALQHCQHRRVTLWQLGQKLLEGDPVFQLHHLQMVHFLADVLERDRDQAGLRLRRNLKIEVAALDRDRGNWGIRIGPLECAARANDRDNNQCHRLS